MTRRTAIAAVLLLTTSVAGVAWAASELDLAHAHHRRDRSEGIARAAADDSLTVADNDLRRKGRHGGEHRRHHDDDDDGDEDHGRGAGRGLQMKADPNAPSKAVPDNGLFLNKARPKVEVQ